MKLFVVSDIHSFYKPLIETLDEAGFDKNNKDHWLISCGDCFDRGPDSVELLHYLMSLERKILIKGNHDALFEDLCFRGFPYSYDRSNGTVKSVQDLGKSSLPADFAECCQAAWDRTAAYRSLLVNYFETENYIFVHSWIPAKKIGFDSYNYQPDWRESTNSDWENAMWYNPFFMAQDGLNQTGKTIVFGHWHCSLGHAMENGFETSEFESNAIWEPYKNDTTKIIGIDRCVAHTKKVNVVVLEDNLLE